MSVRSAILSNFSLFAMASALPSSTRESNVKARDSTSCPSGTWYSKCYTYDGCYSYDPCVVAPTTPTLACPAGTNGTSTGRDMYVVVPGEPGYSAPAVSYFHVQAGSRDIDQVGVFSGIPAGAQACTLMWKTGSYQESTFRVEGNGLLAAVQLGGLDAAQPVSWNAVAAAPAAVGTGHSPDMTNWNQGQFAAATHNAGVVECGEQISVRFETNKSPAGAPAGEKVDVYLEQDEKNGWYVSYTC